MTEIKKLSDELNELLSSAADIAALLTGADRLIEDVAAENGSVGMYAQELIQMALAKAEAIYMEQSAPLYQRLIAMEKGGDHA